MARYLSVVLAVGALLATAGYAADPECWQYVNCMNCTEAPSGQCGWDAATGTCKHGAAGGPVSASSSDATSFTWWWTSNQCCESRTGCTDCTDSASGYCGWSVDRNQCLFGNSWGPAVGFSNSWVSNYVGCPSQCLSNNDCSSCVSQQGCGWLAATQQCVAGSGVGPFFGQPAIMDNEVLSSGSAWYFSSCPSKWNWHLRWSAHSYSLWCIVGGVGAVLLGASVVAGRRRRRIIRQQRSQMAAIAAQAQPTVGAPLLAQAADIQQAYTAQPIYGQLAPMPYYGATPEEGSCSVGVTSIS